jgi:hypothetical protein
MTIDTKNFVATVEDIQELVHQVMEAGQTRNGAHDTYFKALIGTTQSDLKGTKDVTEAMQMKSLALVHKRFYAAVLEAVNTPDIANGGRLKQEEKTRRTLERHRRSNFARSAYSTVRSWLKAGGHDLMAVNVAKTSKAQLFAETPKREGAQRVPSAARIRKRTDTLVERIMEGTRQLANADPKEARAVLDEALQKIARELFQGAVQPTTDPKVAAAEHRPLRAANAMFWPTETQVIRRARMKEAA